MEPAEYLSLDARQGKCGRSYTERPFLYILMVSINLEGIIETNNLTSTLTQPLVFVAAGVVVLVVGGLVLWKVISSTSAKKKNDTTAKLSQELSQEANKSEIIVNSIADGVLLIDASGAIQLINPAAQTIIGWDGHDATNLDYRSVLKIINAKNDIVDSATDPIQQCLTENQSVLTDKLGLRTTSGKQLLVSIMASPLGNKSGVIVVFRDITSQHAEERDMAEFISTASHEMRTPVAAIEGYLGLAINPATATIDDKARSYLTKAQESARHLGQLFQDLLDISKVEDGRMSNNPTIIDVTAFVRTLFDEFAAQYAEKGLTRVFLPDTGQNISPIFYANIDRDHFQEVISNLITNALKYTKSGSVTIDVTGDNDHVYVSVADTGLGIPAEDIPHLFQKFYRVDNSATREIGGTGLGLYLARRLSEAMGGHLNVTSAFGTGSTFTVDVPRVSNDQAQQLAANPAPAQAPPAIPLPPAPVPVAAPAPVMQAAQPPIQAPAVAAPVPVQAPVAVAPMPAPVQPVAAPIAPAVPSVQVPAPEPPQPPITPSI